MPQSPPQTDWTHGPAKWAAVLVLGAASITGLAWSFFGREPRPIYVPAIVQREAPPVEPGPAPIEQASAPANAPGAPASPAPSPGEPTPGGSTPVQTLLAIPAQPVAPPTIEAPPPEPSLARLININTASAPELELLPGIGPALAARIVEYRRVHGRFRSVNELDHVSGIGPRTLEKIRPHATVK